MEGRVIYVFPQPFKPEAAVRPQQTAFQPRVVDLCSDPTGGGVLCKVVVLGDASVGKTALVNRYCRNLFEKDYKSTIGVDFESEIFSVFNRSFTLQLWDTAGQERFKSIASAYYKGARVIIIAVDFTLSDPFNNTKTWLEDAMRQNSNNDCDVFLVGTKKDLCSPSRYERKEKAAIGIAKELGAEYWPTSSLTGENVDAFFNRVAALAFEKAVIREAEVDTTDAGAADGNDQIITISKKNSRSSRSSVRSSSEGTKCCK